MSPNPKFKFRNVTAILVPDVASSAKWYEKHLGLTMARTCRHGDRLTFTHLAQGDVECFLLQNLSALQEVGYIPQSFDLEGFEINIRVDGLAALHEHLSEQLPNMPPISIRNGRREIRVRDFDGYVLVFWEWNE